MNRYILLISVVLLGTTCRKAAVVTDNTLPRVEGSMSLFDKVLKSSEEGWLVEATAKSGLRHIFWMKFNAEGRVVMIADMREQSLKERESSYRLQQRQQPTLSFDTYNYISELSDPDLSRGRGRGIDFEYAFSVALADSLRALEQSGRALTEITQFELSGSTFDGRAIFTRSSKAPIYKMFAVIKTLDSLKSGEKNGKKHTLRIIKIGDKEYHYNFQSSYGRGNLYSRVLALTDLKARKAVPMAFYFDVQARMHFEPAAGFVRTALPRDKEMEAQVKNWVFTFSENIADNINKKTLSFTKTDSLGANKEEGLLLTKPVSESGYIYEARDSALWASQARALTAFGGWLFFGMEQDLRKDVTRVGSLTLFDVNWFAEQKYPRSLVFYDEVPVGLFPGYLHLGQFIAIGNRFYLSQLIPVPVSHPGMQSLAQVLGYITPPDPAKNIRFFQASTIEYSNLPEEVKAITNKDKNDYSLVFTNIAVCLGFEWHNDEKGIMMAFY